MNKTIMKTSITILFIILFNVTTVVANVNPNLIKNPNFLNWDESRNMYSNWNYYSNGITEFTPYSYYAQIDIIRKGTNTQFYQKDISLEPNTYYDLSFQTGNLKNVTEKISVVMIKHGSPYTNYGLNTDLIMTPDDCCHVFSTRFKTKGFYKNVTDGRFMLYFDHSNNNDSYMIYGNFLLQKVE